MTIPASPGPHPAFLAEIERNRAVALLVWKARQYHPFEGPLQQARRRAASEWTDDRFGINDRSLSDFGPHLARAATRPDAAALVGQARRQGRSLSEFIAEEADPDLVPILDAGYRLAGEAVRFEIRHGFSDGPRFRHLTTVAAEPDDIRGVRFETFGCVWREVRHAVVLFADVAPTGLDEFHHALPLNSLEAFIAQRAARVLTTPIFWKPKKAHLRLFSAPPIHPDESGEGYFARVAAMLWEKGAVKVVIEEAVFPLA